MAIKGNLQDMSLPNLVQMICTDRRKAALIVRRQRTEEGILFFEGGEIVHARMGVLEGEDAAYELLQWTEGTFHLGEQSRIPRHTIDTPWHYLMLEAMKRMDEGNLAASAVNAPINLSPQQTAVDEELEYQIINLISQLEFSRAKLAERKARRRPFIALQILTEMVNMFVVFTEEELKKTDGRSLEKTITLTADNYPAVRLLQIRNNRLQPAAVVSLYRGWSAGKADRRAMFTEMASGLVEMIESYFIYITSSFHSTDMADQWRDTCLLFLEELTTTLQKVKF